MTLILTIIIAIIVWFVALQYNVWRYDAHRYYRRLIAIWLIT